MSFLKIKIKGITHWAHVKNERKIQETHTKEAKPRGWDHHRQHHHPRPRPPPAAAKAPTGCSEDARDNRSGELMILLIGSCSGVRYLGSKLQTSDNLFSKFSPKCRPVALCDLMWSNFFFSLLESPSHSVYRRTWCLSGFFAPCILSARAYY